ncbi:MAG: acetate--CoA ligase family protein [Candidatus Micrarchaeaceae archaeon]|jgi:succinyl-CoA synthetase beta subunit
MELTEYMKAHTLLKKYDIKSIESKYVESAKEAIVFSNHRPIVLKVISQKALHKSKNKLVELNLSEPKEIENAFDQLQKRAQQFKPYKILAQKMVKNGIEIIIGGKTDQQFGKMILIGLGGIYVETFKDFALRLCPITEYDAESMLQQLKSRPVIAPNEQTSKNIKELLLKVSKMFYDNEISELDLNPVIIHDNTYDAVDLRLIK